MRTFFVTRKVWGAEMVLTTLGVEAVTAAAEPVSASLEPLGPGTISAIRGPSKPPVVPVEVVPRAAERPGGSDPGEEIISARSKQPSLSPIWVSKADSEKDSMSPLSLNFGSQHNWGGGSQHNYGSQHGRSWRGRTLGLLLGTNASTTSQGGEPSSPLSVSPLAR